MAWDPNSSSWDWDTAGAFTTSQGNECTSSVNSHVEISLSSLGVPAHKNSGFGPCGSRADITSAGIRPVERIVGSFATHTGMANITEELSFAGGIGHNNAGGRIPVVTACSENGVQKCISDNWERSDYGNTDSLELGNQQPNFGHNTCHTALSYKYGHLVATTEHVDNITESSVCPRNMPGVESINNKKENSIFHKQSPKKCFIDSANVVKVQATEEQHSSTATGSVGSADSLTGLHLGKRKYSHDVPLVPEPKGTQRSLSDLRKNRAGSGSQIPRCQVEGCKVDLTSAKDYHRRHKVCEPHSKAGKVVVASLEQRFCQQCSRFHLLSEFDDAKRSCRRRLAGHNKRRRKPQADPLGLHARLQATLGDWAFYQQSRFPRMTIWPDSWDIGSVGLWPRTMECEGPHPYTYVTQVPGLERQVYTNGFSPSISNDKFPLALFQSPKTMMHTEASYSRNHQYLSGSTSCCFSNGLTLVSSSPGAGAVSGIEATSVTPVPQRVADSGRALSLLSLQTNGSQASDVVSLDLSGLTNATSMNNQVMHAATVTPQQLVLLGGQQQFRELSLENLLSPSSNSHSNLNSDHGLSLEKDLYEYSYIQDSNRHGGCGFESSHPGLSFVHSVAMDPGKQTRDLMRTSFHDASSAGNQGQSIALQLESNNSFGDVQSSYGTFF